MTLSNLADCKLEVGEEVVSADIRGNAVIMVTNRGRVFRVWL